MGAKHLCIIDSETDPFEWEQDIQPFCWGIYTDDDFTYLWDDDPDKLAAQLIEHFKDWAWELDIDEKIIVYAHNGGKFDYLFLLKYFDPDLMLVNGRIAKATLFDGLVEFRDSFMIIPAALSNKFDDYMKMKRAVRHKYRAEIISYLKEDCRELFELVAAFVDRFGYQLTLAGTALKQIKKSGYDIAYTFEDYDDEMRPFYFGGRVQCFDVGAFTGHFQYVDINSAYPHAMLDRHWSSPNFTITTELPSPDKNGSWFAVIKAVSSGALPFRDEETRKLYFPNDDIERTYYASGWEINAGIETDTLTINRVECVYMPTLLDDFNGYIKPLYDEKLAAEKSGDKIGRMFAKLLMNSGYGKFGQDGRKFKDYKILPYGEFPDGIGEEWVIDSHTECGQFSIFEKPNPQDRFYNVATAASITGWVRAYLWRSILQCEKPLYCDTDSIICEKFNGAMGDKLGQWAVEAEASEVYIAQRKMYAMKTTDENDPYKTASKGVRLSFDEIKMGVVTGDNLLFKKEAPAMSVKYGARYFSRQVNFENIAKNACANPPQLIE